MQSYFHMYFYNEPFNKWDKLKDTMGEYLPAHNLCLCDRIWGKPSPPEYTLNTWNEAI